MRRGIKSRIWFRSIKRGSNQVRIQYAFSTYSVRIHHAFSTHSPRIQYAFISREEGLESAMLQVPGDWFPVTGGGKLGKWGNCCRFVDLLRRRGGFLVKLSEPQITQITQIPQIKGL